MLVDNSRRGRSPLLLSIKSAKPSPVIESWGGAPTAGYACPKSAEPQPQAMPAIMLHPKSAEPQPQAMPA
jgi:hypothetical protein